MLANRLKLNIVDNQKFGKSNNIILGGPQVVEEIQEAPSQARVGVSIWD